MKITHRYINGKEVKFEDLKNYTITNQIVLDTIHNAINRINASVENNNISTKNAS